VWHTDTLWFDVAVVMTIFAFGNVLFGRFEEHKPRGRRVLKVALVLAVTVLLSATAGRAWAYGVLAVPLLGAAWVHLYWLPKHGISGWTAEPRDKYLELLESRKRRSSTS
jgi:predicted MFS family arabinose efflux permease